MLERQVVKLSNTEHRVLIALNHHKVLVLIQGQERPLNSHLVCMGWREPALPITRSSLAGLPCPIEGLTAWEQLM